MLVIVLTTYVLPIDYHLTGMQNYKGAKGNPLSGRIVILNLPLYSSMQAHQP